MSNYVIALCTCPTPEAAREIATALVQSKLAACVNILPGLLSVYRWQDEVCAEPEVQMLIKTTRSQLDGAFNLLLSMHPYDVPEWLVMDVADGSDTYLNWIDSSLK